MMTWIKALATAMPFLQELLSFLKRIYVERSGAKKAKERHDAGVEKQKQAADGDPFVCDGLDDKLLPDSDKD